MSRLQLPLRSGLYATVEVRVAKTSVLYFCGRRACPHYQGQEALLEGAEDMACALVGYAPERICQPYYLEMAEELDIQRRTLWDRLEEAEAFEAAVAEAARKKEAAA